MYFANCPQCRDKIPYTIEEAGQSRVCPRCHAEVLCQQSLFQTAGKVATIGFGCLSIALLVAIGIHGGVVAVLATGAVVVVFGALALIGGMRVRDLWLIINALLLGMLGATWYTMSKNNNKRSDAGQKIIVVASPLPPPPTPPPQ